MKKLFKTHPRQHNAHHDELGGDQPGPRAISPFTVVPAPPSPDAQNHYAQVQQFQALQQQGQHAVQQRERDRIHEREQQRAYRNSLATYPSGDDISSWELIQRNGQHTHPYRQQRQGINDRERSASVASLAASGLTGSSGALPNPYSQPQLLQSQTPPSAQSQVQAYSTSRTSSLNSIPPGAASQPSPATTTAPLLTQPPAPGSAGSYVPSPTSPASVGLLRKKNPFHAQSQQPQQQQQQPLPPPQASTAAILRALDPSMMGGVMGPPSGHTHPNTHHQKPVGLVSRPSVRSAQREQREQQREANSPPHQLPHPHLRVPLLTSRKDKRPHSPRERSRSHSLSDIEFGAGDGIESDEDHIHRSSDRDVDGERDSLDLERQAREARWRERDLEIEGKASKKNGGAGERESRGIFDRLQFGDMDPKKEATKEEKEKKEKEKKEKDDWKAQLTNIFSAAKDKDRIKNKKDMDTIDPLSLPPVHPRLEISAPMPLAQPLSHGHTHPNIAVPEAFAPNDLQYHSTPAANAPILVSNSQALSQAQGDPLVRMVGLFVSPSQDGIDWALALELSEQTKGKLKSDGKEGRDTKEGESNAKIIAKALRKELKYARPSEQLGAVTLWAVMLQNASDSFITQTSSRKFLDVVEDVITHSRSSAIRDRLLEALGAAAYIANQKGGKDASKRENFKALWRKVKPEILPEEGMPLSMDNPMFHSRQSATHPHGDLDRLRTRPSNDRRSSRNGIIPVEEDMRRLFQECKIGSGNAQLLNEALAFATPEDLKEKDIIKEFYSKCRASQELIHAQIPWASANAEHSRMRQLEILGGAIQNAEDPPSTREEELLAELLCAHEELAEALRIYGEIERVGHESEEERKARERSKVEIRASPMDYQLSVEAPSFLAAPSIAPSSSRSPSPSSFVLNSQTSHSFHSQPPYDSAKYATDAYPTSAAYHQHLTQVQSPHLSGSDSSHSLGQSHNPGLLAPVPTRPLHGPRAPAPPSAPTAGLALGSTHSRSPSPAHASRPNSVALSNASSGYAEFEAVEEEMFSETRNRLERQFPSLDLNLDSRPKDSATSEQHGSFKLSEKAAGKRRMADNTLPDLNDGYANMPNGDALHLDDVHLDVPRSDLDVDDAYLDDTLGPDRWKFKVRYAYDAAAERTKERMRELAAGGPG